MKFDRSLIFFALAIFFYYLSHSTIGIFLPNYYLSVGLSVNQIVLLSSLMFIILGFLPLLNLKYFSKYFERFMILGLVSNAVFFALLIFVKNPLVLGIAYGISLATFYPAFNLMIFRFTDIKQRGMLVMLLYIVLPNLTGIIGPALGGALIHFFSFNITFVLGISLMIVAAILAFNVKYKPVKDNIVIPKDKLFWVFAAIIIIWGMMEVSWIAYPMFLYSITGGFLNMGIVSSVLAIIFTVIAIVVGKISEVHKHRMGFAFLGFVLTSVWFFAIAFVKTVSQLIAVSIIGGLGGVFILALFSIYGDFFQRKYHATMIVLWETFLMFGRLVSLIPIAFFINQFDFHNYFLTIGFISLTVMIPFTILMFLYHKKKISIDRLQILHG
jgi:MFS family permease